MVDYRGRLKYIPKVVETYGKSKDHKDIFIRLAKKLGVTIKKPTEAEVKKALPADPKPLFRPFARKGELQVKPDEMIESINISVTQGSRLLWLKETEREETAA